MQTTALMVQVGARRICLYYTGRRHAGENLARLLGKREPERDKPMVMSDALPRNNAEEEALIRCHCLAHGRRKFSELDEVFPTESAVVVDALKDVFDHEEYARVEQLTAQERLAYHQRPVTTDKLGLMYRFFRARTGTCRLTKCICPRGRPRPPSRHQSRNAQRSLTAPRGPALGRASRTR